MHLKNMNIKLQVDNCIINYGPPIPRITIWSLCSLLMDSYGISMWLAKILRNPKIKYITSLGGCPYI